MEESGFLDVKKVYVKWKGDENLDILLVVLFCDGFRGYFKVIRVIVCLVC